MTNPWMQAVTGGVRSGGKSLSEAALFNRGWFPERVSYALPIVNTLGNQKYEHFSPKGVSVQHPKASTTTDDSYD